MLELVALAFLVWITATFIAVWIASLRTGIVTLVGPYVRVRRETNRVGYFAAVTLLLVPVVAGVALSTAFFKIAFPYQSIPAPLEKGYAQFPRSASEPMGYFPTELTRTLYKCADFPKAIPLLSPLEVSWYSKVLAAAGEPSLIPALTPDKTARNLYRFTWLRSFHKPIVVRIQEGSGGALLMTASRLSGSGGYEPGKVEARIERELTAGEAKRFPHAFSGTNRLKLKAVDCEKGYDGAEWIFEASDMGAYRYVNRWSPKTGPVRALGTTMLSFTGWVSNADY
jgi:hypothetical protein